MFYLYCTNNEKNSLFSTSSLAFIMCRLFHDGYADQCEFIPRCSFDLLFSNN